MKTAFRRNLAVIMLLAALLLGCTRAAVPRPLITAGAADAASVAVALQPDGTQHYAWTQCAEARCSLLYQRAHFARLGLRLSFAPPAGESYLDPDIAATADGVAFIVWRSHNVEADSYNTYYVRIGPETTTAPTRVALGTGTGAGAPKVVANQQNAYAVYLAQGNNSLEVRYRRLRPTNQPGTSYEFPNATAITLADPAIDSAGRLHMALRSELSANNVDSQQVVYIRPAEQPLTIAGGAGLSFSVPALAVTSDNGVYGAYWMPGTTTDTLHRFYVAAQANSAAHVQISLPAGANPWRFNGEVDIEAGQQSLIAFSADNSTTDSAEVWVYNEAESDLDQVTADAQDDGAPRIGKIRATYDDRPVTVGLLVWRAQTIQAVPLPPRQCSQAVYMSGLVLASSVPQQIAPWQAGCNNAAQDFATSGDWAAGIWVDQRARDQARLVPWITYNAYINQVPIVIR